ncbi:hypothetical protein OROGR_020051 [Orobanche gracilis]
MDPRRRPGSKKQNLDKGKGRSSSHPPTDRGSLEALKSKSLYMCCYTRILIRTRSIIWQGFESSLIESIESGNFIQMGCTVREKHIRANRKAQLIKPESDHSTSTNTNGNGNLEKSGNSRTGTKPKKYHTGPHSLSQNPMSIHSPSPNPSSVYDENGWSYCTEE